MLRLFRHACSLSSVTFPCHMPCAGSRVIAMEPEDLSPRHRMHEDDEISVAAQLRSLTQRVANLERELAELRSPALPQAATQRERVAPPPPPMPSVSLSEPAQLPEDPSPPMPSASFENRLG